MPSSGDRSSQVQQLLREAAILGRHGNFDEAERRYRSIQQLLRRAHDPDAHYNFGVVLQGLKRYEDALYRKPRWLLFNKIDAAEDADARIRKILNQLRWKRPWFKVAAISATGTKEVCSAVARELSKK